MGASHNRHHTKGQPDQKIRLSHPLLLAEAAMKFNWAAAVTKLPVEWDDDGNNVVTVTRNVLEEHSKISVEEEITAGGYHFGSNFNEAG